MSSRFVTVLALVALAAAPACAAQTSEAVTDDDSIVSEPSKEETRESKIDGAKLEVSSDALTGAARANVSWTADLQAVLGFQSLPISKEQIVARAFNGEVDQPRAAGDIATTVDGWPFSDGPRLAVVHATAGALDAGSIRVELDGGRPPILELKGGDGAHAYVVTSLTYRVTRANKTTPITLKLRDPLSGSEQTLAWSDVERRGAGLLLVGVRRGE